MGTIIGSLSRREIKILILCKRNTVHMGSHVTRERPNDAIVVLSRAGSVLPQTGIAVVGALR